MRDLIEAFHTAGINPAGTSRILQALKSPMGWRLFSFVAVIVVTLILYSPALQSAFLRDDDLAAVSVIRSTGPWVGFGPQTGEATEWFSTHLYRPFFAVQAWLLYQMFGVNYAGYQIVLVFALCLASVALLALFQHIGLDPFVAGLLALLFVSHPYVSPLVIWVSDAAVWQYLLAALCVLLLIAVSSKKRNYIILLLMLLTAALMRENGLALAAAAIAFAVFAWRTGEYPRQRAAGVLLMAVLCVLAYFVMRTLAVGLWPEQMPAEDAYVFFTHFAPAEVAAFTPLQRLMLSIYTVSANLVASFLPIFRGAGYLRASSWQILGLTLVVFAGAWFAGSHWRPWDHAGSKTLLAALLMGGATILLALLRNPSTNAPTSAWLEIASFSIHGALSMFILLTFLHLRGQQTRTPLAGFALALIVVACVVAFAYFRNRNLYLPALGWLLLLALALAGHPQLVANSHHRLAILTLVASAVLINGLVLFTSLPLPEMRAEEQSRSVSALCVSRANDQVIREVALYYGIPLDEVLRCRESQ